MSKKILIVEDEEDLRDTLADRFTKEGYEVLQAKNGEEGFNMALKEKPAIILTDILMPKKHGIDMIKDIRSLESGKSIPIIVLSNLTDAEYTSDAIEEGVFSYLVKSDWSINDVVEMVEKRLSEK
ncbi:response regulator [Patescibacteria group bacterium]|nr:response regulator [Patescibacteria group bacterium]MBU1952248.1 response regulator [Patescibacteria group bacterium]